jgi:hypothetical protein
MLLAFYGQYKEVINSTKQGGKEVKTLFQRCLRVTRIRCRGLYCGRNRAYRPALGLINTVKSRIFLSLLANKTSLLMALGYQGILNALADLLKGVAS